VHTIFEGTPDRKWLPGEKRQCKLVFIGRDLDREAFQEAFEHCLVSAVKQEKWDPSCAQHLLKAVPAGSTAGKLGVCYSFRFLLYHKAGWSHLWEGFW
jgi:hypothetical protein